MNILLDTHIAVWAITDDRRLTKNKKQEKNLEFTTDEFVEMCHEAGYIHSPLKETHLMAANKLIWEGEGEEHKEPFDRILLAQAISENMHFITSDGKIPGFKQNCVIAV